MRVRVRVRVRARIRVRVSWATFHPAPSTPALDDLLPPRSPS